MSKRPRSGKAVPGQSAQGGQEPETAMANGQGGPSIRRIEPTHELVFQRFIGKLEKLVPLETRAEKPAAKPARPKGQRP
jgi:hypothetical protein